MMTTKLLFLKPINTNHCYFFNSLPLTNLIIKPRQSSSIVTLSQSGSHHYGPSLSKGKITLPLPDKNTNTTDDTKLVDEDQFTRLFDIAALRVPSKDCFALENRLRGHLLNWPRIQNIARVAGDDVAGNLVTSLNNNNSNDIYKEEEEGERKLETLQRRIHGRGERDGERLSPVLYREKLAKTFNARGFVKFRNLARISRPRKKGEEGERWNAGGKVGRRLFAVEVVEDEETHDDDGMIGLLGEEFKGSGSKWKGSTRLLLLDERYAHKAIQDLPQAIQVLLNQDMMDVKEGTFELVRCKLSLFYDYWQMNEILEAMLPKGMIVPSAFETVGHIAHLNLRDEHSPFKYLIAKVVLDKNQPKIQTVVNKTDAIHSDYRTMQLDVLAGNHSLVTTIVENGLRFQVNLATVYWNSRLATERQRLLSSFNHNDVICDVFCGVGPIAISAAKIVKRVYANDLNPEAVDYVERNSVLNKLERKIEIYNMDGRRFINAMMTSDKVEPITHVIMNLPKDAAEFLDAFRGIFRDRPKDKGLTFPMIHVYGFSKARDPEFDYHERIRIALSDAAVNVQMRRVRLVAPGKWMLCASFTLPESVAFAKQMYSM
ncbi:hypothetical protein ACFE04_005601 [Oxalis oulophora]